MKHIKTFDSLLEGSQQLTQEQINYLDEYIIGEWEINPVTGLIDIDGDFECSGYTRDSFIGISFGRVQGNFDCSDNEIKSLTGAPIEVDGDFNCSNNELESLVGAPIKVGGDFDCSGNYLVSLVGEPKELGGDFLLDSSDSEGEYEPLPPTLEGRFEYMEEHPEFIDVIIKSISNDMLDSHFSENPLDLHYLDSLPEVKSGVIARTGIKDFSKLGKLGKSGLI